MSDKIQITWEASDGYAGGSAPQHFKVNPENYKDMSLEEIKDALAGEVQEDFESKVSWVCDTAKYAEEIHAMLTAREKGARE